MDTVYRVQILKGADNISFTTNTNKKDMNPIIPSPAMGKQWGKLGFLALVRQPV